MLRIILRISVLVGGTVLALVGLMIPTWPHTITPTITHISVDEDHHEIYLLDLERMLSLRSARDPNWSGNPHWSPESGRVVFESNRTGNLDIFTAAANGTDIRRLTDNPARDKLPRWSPDGTEILFLSDRDGDFGAYLMDADGSNVRQIMSLEDASIHEPAWSPDGAQLAYVSLDDPNMAGDFEIYLTSFDEQNPFLLTRAPRRSHTPVWSPDGARLAFSSDRDGDFEIYILDINTGNTTRLTYHEAWDRNPTWTPDGKQIVFESFRDEDWELYTVSVDGSGLRRLTDQPGRDGNPR
jgi:Tol biopolymer transport system component